MTSSPFKQPDVDFGRNFEALAERDIDFLLLEEFQVNGEFVAWFCGEIDLLNVAQDGAWHSVFDADGETDLLLRVFQGPQRIGVLIENKVAAAEQPEQAERYRFRGCRMVEQGKLAAFKTVLCAPETYLAARPKNGYDYTVAYEKIAKWFDIAARQST
jgi:hypothetical protein